MLQNNKIPVCFDKDIIEKLLYSAKPLMTSAK